MSTNLGLLQSNLSYMIEKHGVKYHWLLDLFKRLKLPIFDGMKEGLEKANRDRRKAMIPKPLLVKSSVSVIPHQISGLITVNVL